MSTYREKPCRCYSFAHKLLCRQKGTTRSGAEHDEVKVIHSLVIARSEATKQSRMAVPHWIASLCSQ
jgi:hypothetical protein